MSSKLVRTISLALAIGFLVVWILEYRRTSLIESYWLLLLSILSVLFFQFSRLKAATAAKNESPAPKSSKTKSGTINKK